MSVFDEEPDAPLHGECAAEISRLTAERDAARHGWNECEKLGNYQFDQSRKQIVSLRAQVAAGDRLRDALKILHDNLLEYNVINKLGGENNQDMRQARGAISEYDALKTTPTEQPNG
jgi:hypothetical protein